MKSGNNVRRKRRRPEAIYQVCYFSKNWDEPSELETLTYTNRVPNGTNYVIVLQNNDTEDFMILDESHGTSKPSYKIMVTVFSVIIKWVLR